MHKFLELVLQVSLFWQMSLPFFSAASMGGFSLLRALVKEDTYFWKVPEALWRKQFWFLKIVLKSGKTENL